MSKKLKSNKNRIVTKSGDVYKKPKTKQLEISINAWKDYKEVYESILDLADMYGVLKRGGNINHGGKSFHISTARTNWINTTNFIKAFNEQFKPKSVKLKQLREKYKSQYSLNEIKENGKDGFKQFVSNEIVYSSYVRELFNYFPSKEARQEFDYTNNINRASAINELRNYLNGSKSGNNIYVSEYVDKYGFDSLNNPEW